MGDIAPIPLQKDTEAEKKARTALDGTLQDIEQYIMDGLVSSDIASHIPGVKHVIAFARALNAVRDRLLMVKLARFFKVLSDVPLAERLVLSQSLEADPKYRRKVGEHILELLDRIDSERKPAMCGHVFAAYARNEIDPTLLLRLLSAIERVPIYEIDSVRELVEAGPGTVWASVDRETKTALANAGLLDAEFSLDGNMVVLNNTSRAFVALGLDTKTAKI